MPLSKLLAASEAEGRPFDEPEMLAVVVPLLEGLERVHAAGVLHRDIKPSNLIIRRTTRHEDERPELIDFGAAKQSVAGHGKSFAPCTEGSGDWTCLTQGRGSVQNGRSAGWAPHLEAGDGPLVAPGIAAMGAVAGWLGTRVVRARPCRSWPPSWAWSCRRRKPARPAAAGPGIVFHVVSAGGFPTIPAAERADSSSRFPQERKGEGPRRAGVLQ